MPLPEIVGSLKFIVRRKKSTHYKVKRGFTLIELLIVITIISILLAITTFSYTQAQKKGRDGRRKADLKTIQQALELHYQEFGKYPPTIPNDWDGWCARVSDGSYTQIKNALSPTFIETVPTDPKTPSVAGDYIYYKLNNQQYILTAVLENTNDPDRSTVSLPGGCADGVTYNYQVKNP